MPYAMIFPGLAGNELRFLLPGTDTYVTIWLSIGKLVFGGWELLRLAPDGLSPPVFGAPPLEGGYAIDHIYPILQAHMRREGFTLWDARVDWRLPLTANVESVVRQVESILLPEPIHFIAHSRGGFVAAAVAARMVAMGRRHRIGRVVSMGTPWGGSYEPIGYFAGWAETITTIRRVALFAGSPLGQLFSLRQLQQVCASWPGLYEMLPSPALAQQAGDPRVPLLYDPATWSASAIEIAPPHLAAALTRWQAPQYPPAGIPWLHVLGSGYVTRGPLVARPVVGSPACCALDFEGDGIVPEWSARAAGGAVVEVPVDHQNLPSDGRSASVAIAFLKG